MQETWERYPVAPPINLRVIMIPWNKGLTKETDARVAAYSKVFSEYCATPGCNAKRADGNALCRPCRRSLRAYGMTTVDRQKMLDDQNGCCKVCLRSIKFDGLRPPLKTSAMVDHCHVTKKVRGIVCARCNGMLSVIDDYSIDLDNLKKYYTPVV